MGERWRSAGSSGAASRAGDGCWDAGRVHGPGPVERAASRSVLVPVRCALILIPPNLRTPPRRRPVARRDRFRSRRAVAVRLPGWHLGPCEDLFAGATADESRAMSRQYGAGSPPSALAPSPTPPAPPTAPP